MQVQTANKNQSSSKKLRRRDLGCRICRGQTQLLHGSFLQRTGCMSIVLQLCLSHYYPQPSARLLRDYRRRRLIKVLGLLAKYARRLGVYPVIASASTTIQNVSCPAWIATPSGLAMTRGVVIHPVPPKHVQPCSPLCAHPIAKRSHPADRDLDLVAGLEKPGGREAAAGAFG